MLWGLSAFEHDEVKEEVNIDIEDIKKKAEEVSDYINNNLIDIFCKIHNIDKQYNMLSIKRENIARTAFFMNVKKKYCMRIVDMEGVPVDEIFVRGIDIRRSDYSTITKEKLSELINLILSDDYSPLRLKEFIADTRYEMRNLAQFGSYKIGKPVSYNKTQYKGDLPAHIRGMKLWNKLEYDHFYVGSKGYMFRLKGIDITNSKIRNKINYSDPLFKSNYIVMPIDMEQLPVYYDIDVNHTVKLAWDDRVEFFEKELLDK